jgi:hypothetical protein
MRRRKLIAAVVGLAVLVVVGAFVLWPQTDQGDRITRENYNYIKIGMSRAEVEAILGPAGDYATGSLRFAGPTLRVFSGEPSPPSEYVLSVRDAEGYDIVRWRNDTGILTVYFDRTGQVFTKGFFHVERVEQGPLDNLLWRAKRLWRRWFPPR